MEDTQKPAPVAPPKQRRRKPRPHVAGLTLIEILVVVTILGIIASIAGVAIVKALDDAKIDATKLQLSELNKSLDLYKVKFNRYPTTAEGLTALTTPQGGKQPVMDTIPQDAWGSDFIYVSPGQHNTGKFDLQSKGPDGVADSGDDVSNWTP